MYPFFYHFFFTIKILTLIILTYYIQDLQYFLYFYSKNSKILQHHTITRQFLSILKILYSFIIMKK